MKIRLTHKLDDQQLRAVARVNGARTRRKASRTEVVQFVTRAVDRALAEAEELRAKFEIARDVNQLTLLDARK